MEVSVNHLSGICQYNLVSDSLSRSQSSEMWSSISMVEPIWKR